MSERGVRERLLWVVLMLAPAQELHAQASVQLHVELAKSACPNAGQVEKALGPLLEDNVSLVFEQSATTTRRARVVDSGARYGVEIDGQRREVEDARRDCVERARVASVFIALNMRAQQGRLTTSDAPSTKPSPATKPSPTTKPSPAASKPSDEDDEAKADEAKAEEELEEEDEDSEIEELDEPDPPEPPPGFGVVVFGIGEHSTEAERTALGAGAGAFYMLAPFRFEATAGLLAPIELELEPSAELRGSVQLTRVPISLAASYLMRAGSFQLGPTVGLALDVLHIEGEGVERPQTQMRMNAGVLLAADIHLWTSPSAWQGPTLGLLFRLQMRMFPRAYRLAVDPTGSLGDTPRTWLGGELGIEWRI